MKASSPTIEEVAGAQLLLRITVSPAGQQAALNALVGQCVPVLQNPDAFSAQRRRELAERLARAIQPRGFKEEMDGADACDETPEHHDPSCWTEDQP